MEKSLEFTKVNIAVYLDKKGIFFENHRKRMTWVRRYLKLESLCRIGPNHMVEEEEIKSALIEYSNRKTKTKNGST